MSYLNILQVMKNFLLKENQLKRLYLKRYSFFVNVT